MKKKWYKFKNRCKRALFAFFKDEILKELGGYEKQVYDCRKVLFDKVMKFAKIEIDPEYYGHRLIKVNLMIQKEII